MPHQILVQRGGESDPTFSPDGSKILYIQTVKGRSSVWTVAVDGSEPRRLAGGLSVPTASWSPNGQLVALAAVPLNGDRHMHLYIVSATGDGLRQISHEEALDGPVWTPDGHWITFSNFDGEIKRVHPVGTHIETYASLPGEEIRHLLWSPNGKHLAYMARPFPPED